jgi:endo-1,4-beta-xylanase
MDKPQSLIVNGDFARDAEGWSGVGEPTLKATAFDPGRPELARAVRLESNPPADASPWTVQFGQQCTAAVRKGDAVYFRAWLRSPDKSTIAFIYEMAAAPNTKYISQKVTLTPEWREYRFMGRAPATFAPAQSQAKFFLGYGKGTVEVADVRVENYGKAPDSAFSETIDYWGGREHNDDWRAPALARIEQTRKGDVTIRVLDAAGKPVPGAVVHVEQKRHAFRFGTAAPAGRLVDTQNPDNLRFQQEVARLFNTVTFENDLKWASTSPATLATVDKAAQWLKDHDIELRGHCLLWGSYQHLPEPQRSLRGPALLDACKQHVTDYATRMKGRVYLWDVVNEAGSNTELWDEIGWENFANAYKWAHEADPTARLCYNDYSIASEDDAYRKKVHARIQYLLDHGAPVTTLGDQAHLGTPLVRLSTALSVWDEWAKFGKDLEVTEFDLGCADDQIHADYVRDFMTAVFSQPQMQAFIMWGFWEGSHWRASDHGAMVRRDWTPRPAMLAYEDLVFKQWWTKWQGQSDAAGVAKLRAFYGKHEITAEAGGKRASTVIQTTPGEAATVELRLP